MAEEQPKKTPFVNADNRRLLQELEQLCQKTRPVESRCLDRGGGTLVIRGK